LHPHQVQVVAQAQRVLPRLVRLLAPQPVDPVALLALVVAVVQAAPVGERQAAVELSTGLCLISLIRPAS
jgi:hypothetical protein